MKNYFILQVLVPLDSNIIELALKNYNAQGVLEFSLEEKEVDEILQERSYSGGDIPIAVLNEVEDTVKNNTPYKIYFNLEAEALSFQEMLIKNYNLNSSIMIFEDKDWNEEWKKSYKEIVIEEDFKILPSWEEQRKRKKDLLIYPGMGFGTGTHETTYLCLLLFNKFVKKTNLCLDFGCGSGILGLATFLFNTSNKVDFYDIDDKALNNTKQNINLNGFEKRNFNLFLPDNINKFESSYDLIFANILQNVILENVAFLNSKLATNGFLILSGLLFGQEIEVVESFLKESSSLEVLEVAKKNDWIAIILKNKQ